MRAWHEWLPVAEREFGQELARMGNTAVAVKAAEKKLGFTFPRRYREFISMWNGGTLRLRFLTLTQVVKTAKQRRGDERNPHGELPEHYVPIAAEPYGNELYCVSTAPQAGQRVFAFDPEEPDSGASYPDFEAFLLHHLAGVADTRGPDGQYLVGVAAVHGIDWDQSDVMAKWKTWEQCRHAIPPVPKPPRGGPPILLENFEPGVLGLHKGFHSVSGQLARRVSGTISSTPGKSPRWTLEYSRGAGKARTVVELGPAELRKVSQAVERYIASRRYEKDKDWSALAAALKKGAAVV